MKSYDTSEGKKTGHKESIGMQASKGLQNMTDWLSIQWQE
jgi:hypothetical protein